METAISVTAWAELPHISDVEPLGPADMACLDEVRSVLEKHGALDRFGINLIHRHFELEDDEIVLESTECTTRRQVVEVRPRAVIQHGNVIATQWIFGAKGNAMSCRGYCDYQDYAHRNRHMTVPNVSVEQES
jgi:hypothetical protein